MIKNTQTQTIETWLCAIPIQSTRKLKSCGSYSLHAVCWGLVRHAYHGVKRDKRERESRRKGNCRPIPEHIVDEKTWITPSSRRIAISRFCFSTLIILLQDAVTKIWFICGSEKQCDWPHTEFGSTFASKSLLAPLKSCQWAPHLQNHPSLRAVCWAPCQQQILPFFYCWRFWIEEEVLIIWVQWINVKRTVAVKACSSAWTFWRLYFWLAQLILILELSELWNRLF